jgi:redox-sensitive bicupin YhaK (pirin superfamily)
MTAIKKVKQLGFHWETQDPFLFCAYHIDQFPKGQEHLGPDSLLLKGRYIGQDFTIKDGWRMYHGQRVPGFPAHPHSGFETVTLVEQGFADHSDSLGAAGRFGNGDVQWMTAGKGVMHCEMFPLLNQEKENPFLLFQLWLNLPRKSKGVDPYFRMLWNEEIPVVEKDGVKLKIVAGNYKGTAAAAPTPNSWAADPANEVAIWTIKMEPGAEWEIPTASEGTNRTLFFYNGNEIETEGFTIPKEHSLDLFPTEKITIKNGDTPSEFVFLQGKPIGEPVVQQGPFVANSQQGIQDAVAQYQKDQFGGWPWESYENVHDGKRGRFAIHADGREEVKS